MQKSYVLECPEACSLKANSRVGTKVTEMMLAGKSYREIVNEVKETDGYVLYPGTMTRHKRHIIVTGTIADKVPGMRLKASNIEILESIIQKGFENQKNWKPTISDTMKAMDMWFRLTQGNPFDELLDTLAKASIGEEEESNPAAIAAADEFETGVSDAEDEDVPEPVFA